MPTSAPAHTVHDAEPNSPVGPVAGTAAAVPFGLLSALRRRRIFHPVGVAFAGTLEVDGSTSLLGDVPLFTSARNHPAVVRFSRGIGLPPALPDILGIAVKLPDAHGRGEDQDFLLVTSGDGAVGRHVLVPAGSFGDRRYSTLLMYRAGDQRVLFGLEPGVGARNDRPTLGDLDQLGDGHLRFTLSAATASGTWERVGELRVERKLDAADAEQLRFNPWNCGGGLEPTGPLNAIRDAAYKGSQFGRRLVRH